MLSSCEPSAGRRIPCGWAPRTRSIPAHQLTVFRGANGSGKEMLLRICGLLETADQGELLVQNRSISEFDETSLAELRRRHIGYLFAAPFLLQAFTVIENVVMPMFKVLDSGRQRRVREPKISSSLSALRSTSRSAQEIFRYSSSAAWPWPARWQPSRRCCSWRISTPTCRSINNAISPACCASLVSDGKRLWSPRCLRNGEPSPAITSLKSQAVNWRLPPRPFL